MSEKIKKEDIISQEAIDALTEVKDLLERISYLVRNIFADRGQN
jgi:hypothetical protein